MDGYKRVATHRSGWRGVIDAIVAAVTGKPSLPVFKDVTFSVYVKTHSRVKLDIAQPLVEVHRD